MSDQVDPLPTDHIFVLQLQESRGGPRTGRAGRVEHLASGEAARFATTADLWGLVDKVLTEPTRREKGHENQNGHPNVRRVDRRLILNVIIDGGVAGGASCAARSRSLDENDESGEKRLTNRCGDHHEPAP